MRASVISLLTALMLPIVGTAATTTARASLDLSSLTVTVDQIGSSIDWTQPETAGVKSVVRRIDGELVSYSETALVSSSGSVYDALATEPSSPFDTQNQSTQVYSNFFDRDFMVHGGGIITASIDAFVSSLSGDSLDGGLASTGYAEVRIVLWNASAYARAPDKGSIYEDSWTNGAVAYSHSFFRTGLPGRADPDFLGILSTTDGYRMDPNSPDLVWEDGDVGALWLGMTSSASTGPLNSIPIPPAVWLFGSALGVMGVMRRKMSS